MVSGLPARPTAAIRPAADPDATSCGRPRTASRSSTLVITTSQVSRLVTAAQCDPVAGGLAEAGRNSSPVRLRRRLDLDDQAGVAEPDPVAGARPVAPSPRSPVRLRVLGRSSRIRARSTGVTAAGRRARRPAWREPSRARSLAPGASSGPSTSPAKPTTTRAPPIGTSRTSTADAGVEAHGGAGGDGQVPAVAAARSKRSRGLTSKKWKCEVTLIGTSAVLTTSRRRRRRSDRRGATPGPPLRSTAPGARRRRGARRRSGPARRPAGCRRRRPPRPSPR